MEPNFGPQAIPDQMRLELGHLVVDRFFGLDPQPGERLGLQKEEATNWLHQIGFDQVEWCQPADDILHLSLWRSLGMPGMRDEFILEFAGHDDMVVSLFNFTAERIL